MHKIAVTNIIKDYHVFDKEFWLGYKTLEKLYPDFDSIKMILLKTKRIDPVYCDSIPNYKEEKDLLELEWKQKSDEARNQGIETHKYIENLFLTNPNQCKSEFCISTDLYKLETLETLTTCSEGIFVETRLEYLLDPDYLLIGVPDCFIIHDGVIDIYDWKVLDAAPKFKATYDVSHHQAKKLKFPLNATDDCNGIHYTIQLGIYLWMLLRLRPDLKPGKLTLVWIQENKVKKTYDIEYLEEKINKLLTWHVKNLKLQEEIKKCKEIKY